jgi:hypothetical protein
MNYVFLCTNCDFILGIRYANLPLVARHKYDTHFLKFTYAFEDNYGEYYCLICEKKETQTIGSITVQNAIFPLTPNVLYIEGY